MNDSYWISETLTYKIFAESEEEARKIWNRYWIDGEDINNLDVKLKGVDVEADWNWEEN